MNNARRKIIRDILAKIEELDNLRMEIYYAIEEVRDEEQEAFDNLPESIQYGEKGQAMEQTISYLEDAMSDFENLELPSDNLENAL